MKMKFLGLLAAPMLLGQCAPACAPAPPPAEETTTTTAPPIDGCFVLNYKGDPMWYSPCPPGGMEPGPGDAPAPPGGLPGQVLVCVSRNPTLVPPSCNQWVWANVPPAP